MNDRLMYDGCPLCKSADLADSVTADCSRHPLYQPAISPSMRWKQCRKCGHVFTEGYFTDEACKLIFGKTHAIQEVGDDLEQQRYVSARMIDRVLPYAAQGPWLDVGFGNGSLLFTAQEYGFEPVGVDLRERNVGVMSSLGIRAYCADLATLALEFECAVVSMADVLEHMPYPAEGLRAARRLLRAGGVLLVSMPNMENILWKALDQTGVNPYWGEIEHYHNFSRSRLYSLLRENGFEPLRYAVSERYRVCMEVIARKV